MTFTIKAETGAEIEFYKDSKTGKIYAEGYENGYSTIFVCKNNDAIIEELKDLRQSELDELAEDEDYESDYDLDEMVVDDNGNPIIDDSEMYVDKSEGTEVILDADLEDILSEYYLI